MTHHTLKPWLLTAALAIASLASCASSEEKAASQPTIERIEQRGKMLVGTTGDYRPLSFREEDDTYLGFGSYSTDRFILAGSHAGEATEVF